MKREAFIFFIIVLLNLNSILAIDYRIPANSILESSREDIPTNLPWYPVIVFGDNRPSDTSSIKYTNTYYSLVNEIRVINPLAVIGTGDHTGKGTRSQISEFVRTMRGLSNVWVCLGNHDLKSNELSYWVSQVAPEFYRIDSIAGWSIVFANSDVERSRMDRELERLFTHNNRSYILVIHRPLYPNVGHNIWSEVRGVVEKYIRDYNVKLVLQGHWHGYAAMEKDGVEYIITGGAGAPLYHDPAKIPGAIVAHKYHYLYLILYPNGTYSYTPVYIHGGEIVVKKINSSSWIITNTKTDLWLNHIEIPVRIKTKIADQIYNIVLLANPNGKTVVSYRINGDKLYFYINSSRWYVYTKTSNGEYTVLTKEHPYTIVSIKTATTPANTIETPLTQSTIQETSGGYHSDISAYIVAVIAVSIVVTTIAVLYKRRH